VAQQDRHAQAVGPDVLDQRLKLGAFQQRENLRRRVDLQLVGVHR
jgi:hypothetical protein